MAEKLQETTLKKVKILFGFVVIALLTLYQNFNILYQGTKPPEILWAVLAVSALLLGKIWKDHGYRTLLLLYLIIVLRAYLGERDRFWWGEYTFFYGLMAYLVCYPFAQAVDRDWLPKLLRIGGILWVISSTTLSALGVYSALTGISLANISNSAFIELSKGSVHTLHLYYAPYTGAAIESYTIIIALILLLTSKGKAKKSLIILSIVILLLALSLSACRSAYIATGFSIGCFLSIVIFNKHHFFRPVKKPKVIFFKGIVIICLVVCITTITASSYIMLSKTRDWLFDVRNYGLLPAAHAEETEKEIIKIREKHLVSSDGTLYLSGRDRIWMRVFQYLKENPSLLLKGASVIAAMDGPNNISNGRAYPDAHSLYVQTLLECGIPGLLLLLIYLGYFIIHCIRIWRSTCSPLWIKLLPLIPINILLIALVECIPCIIYGLPNLYHLHLMIGVTALYGKESKITAKTQKELVV